MEPNQTPTPTHTPNKKMILSIVVVLLILALAYILSTKYTNIGWPSTPGGVETAPRDVVVERTEAANGALPVPPSFPADIPVEGTDITESVTTSYSGQNSQQLSLNYQSAKTVAEKYAEYKTYMLQAGYSVEEGDADSPVRALFGEKPEANLTVVISSQDGKTLVQLAYLLK